MYRYKILLQKHVTYYEAEVPALPGIITHGKTQREAIENAEEAIKSHIKALKKEEEAIPEEDDPPHVFKLLPVTEKEESLVIHGRALRSISGRDVAKILIKFFDFAPASSSGSHLTLRRVDSEGRTIARTTIPMHDEVGIGLLNKILRKEAHISRKEFADAYEKL